MADGVRDAGRLLNVDKDELPGSLAAVANGGGDGAAVPDLASHAVEVGEAEHSASRHDSGARAGGHGGGGRQLERDEQFDERASQTRFSTSCEANISTLDGLLFRLAIDSPRCARAAG